MKQGVFITFEGGEGAGKTTLIEAVFKELLQQGYPVLKTREPGGTALGEKIRHLVLEQTNIIAPLAELSLFLASRAQHVSELILPALQAGQIVLCDRFNDSTIAYQGAARGLGMKQVEAMCSFITSNLTPDLTLYLDIDPKVGLARIKKERLTDRIEAEKLNFHQAIRTGFLAIHKNHPERFYKLDATLQPILLLHQAMQLILKVITN